jgi:trimeric autotransporter adhesin
MSLSNTGALLIGPITTAQPAGYKLYVTDGILTEKVKVSLSSTLDWSDYVFDKAYQLKPLEQVEEYINFNKHLPEVPSATEMVATGLDVAQMDALLLKKIEELTLYMIELKKENEKMKQQILALQH